MRIGSVSLKPSEWWAGTPSPEALDEDFFGRPAQEVAPDLLGTRLVSAVDGRRAEGVIVEVEAYLGRSDPASHAAARIGRTRRNATMFGPPGLAYVYLSYGIHWCLNVVVGGEDDPCAVLIRAVDPVDGLDVMSDRRGRSRDLGSGPGRVGQALGVTGALDGHDLSTPPLRLLAGWPVAPSSISVSQRIGISRAKEWPLRFYVLGNASVSRSRRGGSLERHISGR